MDTYTHQDTRAHTHINKTHKTTHKNQHVQENKVYMKSILNNGGGTPGRHRNLVGINLSLFGQNGGKLLCSLSIAGLNDTSENLQPVGIVVFALTVLEDIVVLASLDQPLNNLKCKTKKEKSTSNTSPLSEDTSSSYDTNKPQHTNEHHRPCHQHCLERTTSKPSRDRWGGPSHQGALSPQSCPPPTASSGS